VVGCGGGGVESGGRRGCELQKGEKFLVNPTFDPPGGNSCDSTCTRLGKGYESDVVARGSSSQARIGAQTRFDGTQLSGDSR